MQQKFEHITTGSWPLLLGLRAGSAGETCTILIVLCGAYLIARRMMNWRIPLAMLLSAFVVSGLFRLAEPAHYPTPWFMLSSGGLVLCAFFMATDPVGAPVTPKGVWIFGALVGFITIIIRLKGGLPEGVMYAILLGNALTPLIDNLTQPRTFGALKKVKAVVA